MFLTATIHPSMDPYIIGVDKDDGIAILHRLHSVCAVIEPSLQDHMENGLYRIRMEPKETGKTFIIRFKRLLEEAYYCGIKFDEEKKVNILSTAFLSNPRYKQFVANMTINHHGNHLTVSIIETLIEKYDGDMERSNPSDRYQATHTYNLQSSNHSSRHQSNATHSSFAGNRANRAQVTVRPSRRFEVKCYICGEKHHVINSNRIGHGHGSTVDLPTCAPVAASATTVQLQLKAWTMQRWITV
jgi:hypothetical protein